jgi:hypothetical protein
MQSILGFVMQDCGLKIWRHQLPTSNNDHLNHNRPWTKPAEMAPLRPTWGLAPTPSSLLDGGRPTEQAHRIFYSWETLRYCGNASLPEQRSTLRAIHPLTPPKDITACLGGCCPFTWLGALGGHFCRSWPWLWWSLCVFWGQKPIYLVEPWHIGYWVSSESSYLEQAILALNWCCDVESTEKRIKCANVLHRLANYPRLYYFSERCLCPGGAYAPAYGR